MRIVMFQLQNPHIQPATLEGAKKSLTRSDCEYLH